MNILHFRKYAFFLSLLLFYIGLSISYPLNGSPKILNISIANPFFVGRKEKIKQIHSYFKKRGEVKILAITGGPGFGKTQIAKKYALQFGKEYELVWWIDAQQEIPNQFEELALELNSLLYQKEK